MKLISHIGCNIINEYDKYVEKKLAKYGSVRGTRKAYTNKIRKQL